MKNKLDNIYLSSKKVSINKDSKIVIMSDCHRGEGNNNDNFAKNKLIYKEALNYYYRHDFMYVELGDGDEMWEVKNWKNIIEEYIDIFRILKKFHEKNRLVMIYGNHDLSKKSKKVLRKYFYNYYNSVEKKNEELLKDLIVYESLIIEYNGKEIFLIHGHQADFFSGTLWRISRFLVRYVWRLLEFFGMKAPTSTAKNNQVTNKVEKKLEKWSNENNKILISGHTHRPIYPESNDSLYFNDGSCIHYDGITCIEIVKGKISLVKWVYEIKDNKVIVQKEIIAGFKEISSF